MTVDTVVNVVTVDETTTVLTVDEVTENVTVTEVVESAAVLTAVAGPQGIPGPEGSGVFSRGGTVFNGSGVEVGNVIVWRVPFDCTATAVYAYRVGGDGATVNASKGSATTPIEPLLADDLSLDTDENWLGGTDVQNVDFVAGDTLVIQVVSVDGMVTEIGIQVEFFKPQGG